VGGTKRALTLRKWDAVVIRRNLSNHKKMRTPVTVKGSTEEEETKTPTLKTRQRGCPPHWDLSHWSGRENLGLKKRRKKGHETT